VIKRIGPLSKADLDKRTMEYEFTDSEVRNYSDITPDYYSSSINPALTTDESVSDDVQILTSSTTVFPWPAVTEIGEGAGRNVTTGEMMDCVFLDYNYEPITTVISASLFIFGILFCIFGMEFIIEMFLLADLESI